MSSPQLRPISIDKGDETAVVLPSPVYNNRSGGFRKSWRLNSETFETQKKTEAQIAGLHRRLPKHFNSGSKEGIVAYYRKQNQLVEQFQVRGGRTGSSRESPKQPRRDQSVGNPFPAPRFPRDKRILFSFFFLCWEG